MPSIEVISILMLQLDEAWMDYTNHLGNATTLSTGDVNQENLLFEIGDWLDLNFKQTQKYKMAAPSRMPRPNLSGSLVEVSHELAAVIQRHYSGHHWPDMSGRISPAKRDLGNEDLTLQGQRLLDTAQRGQHSPDTRHQVQQPRSLQSEHILHKTAAYDSAVFEHSGEENTRHEVTPRIIAVTFLLLALGVATLICALHGS